MGGGGSKPHCHKGHVIGIVTAVMVHVLIIGETTLASRAPTGFVHIPAPTGIPSNTQTSPIYGHGSPSASFALQSIATPFQAPLEAVPYHLQCRSHAQDVPLREGDRVPEDVTWYIRKKVSKDQDMSMIGLENKKTKEDEEAEGHFDWATMGYEDVFRNKRVVVFALPGAYTPTCTLTHLPIFEQLYDDIKKQNVDEVYCLSVNDSFVMNAWMKQLGITKVKPIPDGVGEFTHKMKMDVKKDNLGFGMRSWRYSMVVNDGIIEKMFIEEGRRDNAEDDPFNVSDAQTLLIYLRSNRLTL